MCWSEKSGLWWLIEKQEGGKEWGDDASFICPRPLTSELPPRLKNVRNHVSSAMVSATDMAAPPSSQTNHHQGDRPPLTTRPPSQGGSRAALRRSPKVMRRHTAWCAPWRSLRPWTHPLTLRPTRKARSAPSRPGCRYSSGGWEWREWEIWAGQPPPSITGLVRTPWNQTSDCSSPISSLLLISGVGTNRSGGV